MSMNMMMTGASRHAASGPSQVFAMLQRVVTKTYSLQTKASVEETLRRLALDAQPNISYQSIIKILKKYSSQNQNTF
jgi:hypothetical protein